jgi:DNA-directed RNA polymerase specialized sigma24 family protein
MLHLGHVQRLAAAAANKERVLALAGFLPEPERIMLEALLREGVSPHTLAKLRGTTTRTVHRRAAMLVRRVSSPAFAVAVAHDDAWDRVRAGAARMCVVEGLSVRVAASRLGVSLYAVRRELSRVHAMAEAMTLAERLPDVPGLGALRRSA